MTTIDLDRNFGPEDRAAIETITRSSGMFTDIETNLALDVFDEALGENKSGYRFVLARSDEEVIGYACWGKDEQTVSSFELYWIAVDDSVRGQGVGSQLLQEVESAVRDVGGGTLFLETAGKPQYLPTRLFYRKRGYEIVAWIDDYYEPGDARVFFAKRL
ncbi:MAG: GNAT family N-acetyltransferase [Pseudomonadales bacterium]|nr:GNAT family N-acetyltransferase [Pseudomonadales bacterium]